MTIGKNFSLNGQDYRFFDYNSIETLSLKYRKDILQENYSFIVALLRGGAYLATMLSQSTNLPLEVLKYDRKSDTVSTSVSKPTIIGQKILLVEDIAGKGYTLQKSKQHLEKLGYTVDVFTVCFDSLSRIIPKFGIKLEANCLAYFPWERMVSGATDISRKENDADSEVWKTGFDLDGVFFPDLPVQMYQENLQKTLSLRDTLPPLERPLQWEDGGTIVSARLEEDRERTLAQLERIKVYPKKLILVVKKYLNLLVQLLIKQRTILLLNQQKHLLTMVIM